MQKYDEYTRLFSDTPGWFEPIAIATWDALLDFQHRQNIQGNILEVGVFQGKSAGMEALHAKPSEKCVFVDMLPMTDAKRRIDEAAPQANCTYLQMMSSSLRLSPEMKTLKRSVRWFHIDGGHSAAEVEKDLEVAHEVLQSTGVVVLDDFFTPAYPQIVQAVFKYLFRHPSRFSLFLCGHNKGYLCRPAAAPMYLTFVKQELYNELEKRGCGNITLYKTTTPNEVNAFGSVQSEDGVHYRGLDSNHSVIQI